MPTSTTLGSLRVSLRELLGLRLDDLADQLNVAKETLEEREADDTAVHERGNPSVEVIAPELADEDLQASLFFFRGAAAQVYPKDLPVLSKHLTQARRLATQHHDAGLSRGRYEREPVPSTWRDDAAMQGYRLARLVRERLGVPTQPLGAIVQQVATPLGVYVARDKFIDKQLGAMAARVEGAALILLATPTTPQTLNPARARALIAHELCHLLFDDDRGATLAMFTDTSLLEDKRRAHPRDLHESRANGFAAELLLPRGGVRELLGAPQAAGVDPGRRLVLKASQHFEAPWPMTTNHLRNLGYLTDVARRALEFSRTGENSRSSRESSAESPPPQTPPFVGDPIELAYAARAQASAASAQLRREDEQAVQQILSELTRIASGPITNDDDDLFLTETVDRLLRHGQLSRLKLLLSLLPLDTVSAAELTGTLMITRPAREALGSTRKSLLFRAHSALLRHHQWAPELALETIERLQ